MNSICDLPLIFNNFHLFGRASPFANIAMHIKTLKFSVTQMAIADEKKTGKTGAGELNLFDQTPSAGNVGTDLT